MSKQSSVKYLGVHIDKDLTWKTHMNHLRQTCLARLAITRRASHHLPCHIRKLLYQTFVLPNLDYCLVVLHSCGVMLSNTLQGIPCSVLLNIISYMHKIRGPSHFQSIIKSQATTTYTNMSGGLAVYTLPERATGHLSLVLHST